MWGRAIWQAIALVYGIVPSPLARPIHWCTPAITCHSTTYNRSYIYMHLQQRLREILICVCVGQGVSGRRHNKQHPWALVGRENESIAIHANFNSHVTYSSSFLYICKYYNVQRVEIVLCFYQPAAREARSRLVLRLLCIFRIYLCACTYHVCNNYVTQSTLLPCDLTQSTLAIQTAALCRFYEQSSAVTSSRQILRSRGDVDATA